MSSLSKAHLLLVAQLLLESESVVRPIATTSAAIVTWFLEDFTQATRQTWVREDIIRVYVRLRFQLRYERGTTSPTRNHFARLVVVFVVTARVRRNDVRLIVRLIVRRIRRRRSKVCLEDRARRRSHDRRLLLSIGSRRRRRSRVVTVDSRLRVFEQSSTLFGVG